MSDELVETGWYCHPTPDGKGFHRFHDKDSVQDQCIPVYVKAEHVKGRLDH